MPIWSSPRSGGRRRRGRYRTRSVIAVAQLRRRGGSKLGPGLYRLGYSAMMRTDARGRACWLLILAFLAAGLGPSAVARSEPPESGWHVYFSPNHGASPALGEALATARGSTCLQAYL